MTDKEVLITNIDKINTTKLGSVRIENNLNIDDDVIIYLKNEILNDKALVYKKGKNYYCEIDNIIVTINSYNYCIITAHKRRIDYDKK